MTRYPVSRHSTRHGWEKREVQKKWRSLLAVFITVVLFLAVANGLIKSFSLKKNLGSSSWSGKSSFVIALAADPASVFIFQKDSKRMVLLTLNNENYLPTGNQDQPIAKTSSIVEEKDGRRLERVLSLAFRSNIENYLIFKTSQKIDRETAQKLFKNFASLTTPLTLLIGGQDKIIMSTNITRIDLFRLWWQIKGFSVNSLDLVDLGQATEELIQKNNQKVLVVDEVFLHREISKYLEDLDLRKENLKVEIDNASDYSTAASLASDFVTSVGGSVISVETSDVKVDKTYILTSQNKKYTSRYLAKIFKCDIKSTPESKDEDTQDKIRVVLGQDFAARYSE